MPKSKKKKSRKNKKHGDNSKTVTQDNSVTANKNTTETDTVVVPVTVVDVVIDKEASDEFKIAEEIKEQKEDVLENTADIQENISVTDTSKTDVTVDSDKLDDSNDGVTSAPATTKKKKRFSFLRKKDRSLSDEDTGMDSSKNDTATVQRASSMSHFDREPHHKSKIPRFRSSKKKNNLSASCSHVESTSLVLNPGMDDWRMTGLLHTVEKSKSSQSLNSITKTSEKEELTKELASSFTEKTEDKNPTIAEEIELQPTKKEQGIEIEVIESTSDPIPEIKDQVELEPAAKEEESEIEVIESVNEQTRKNAEAAVATTEKRDSQFVEANIDFEYSAEIHNKPKPIVIDVQMNTTREEEEEKSVVDLVEVGSPTLKDASTDAELYELENDERVVTIRKLEDIVRESKMSLPKEVVMNDWLVLNLTSREIPSF